MSLLTSPAVADSSAALGVGMKTKNLLIRMERRAFSPAH
jgi:hypothetical protein